MNESDITALVPRAVAILRVAMADDMEQAGMMLNGIQDEFGPDAVPYAVIVWCDVAARRLGVPAGARIAPRFLNTDTGDINTVDNVPWDVAWAGRLITARWNDDRETYEALINSVPDAPAWNQAVGRVLSTIAAMLRNPPPVGWLGHIPGRN